MDEVTINPRATLRRHQDEVDYSQAKLTGGLKRLIDEEPIVEFEHWLVIQNRFPYSVAFKIHHLLLPRRLVALESELTQEEIDEFRRIKRDFGPKYDILLENLGASRSVLDHYHVHLLTYYDKREEMGL